jgi:glycosyltransferase involved in cell wall biosynthesis
MSSSLPSFLRPLQETLAQPVSQPVSQPAPQPAIQTPPAQTSFADFLKAEAAKAGLVTNNASGNASANTPSSAGTSANSKSEEKCRFMIVGTHAHQYTGYSKVTYNMVRELAKEESWLDLIHFGFQKHPQIPPLYRPYPPQVKVVDAVALEVAAAQGKEPQSTFGFAFLPEVIKREKPHVVLIYNDMSVIAQFLESIRKSGIERNFKLWIYVDQVYTMQPQPFIDLLNRDADRVFAFTSYWKKALKDQGVNRPLDIIGHGFDSAVFKPMPKMEARKMMGIPEDAFIYMSLNRNTPRKRYDLLVMAFAELVLKYPTKPVYLLCICDKGERGGFLIFDIYLRELKKRGADVDRYSSRIILSAKELSFRDDEINTFYNVADVGVSTAEGEGYGLCNFEQIGVGIPQVVPDIGGFKEYCTKENSVLVEAKNKYYLPLAYSPVSGEAASVDPHDYCLAMETYLNDTVLKQKHGAAGRETVLKYTWPSVFAGMLKQLKRVHQDVLDGVDE